jgi:hypothetical protein
MRRERVGIVDIVPRSATVCAAFRPAYRFGGAFHD